VSFTEPNIQNVPKDFEIQMPTLIEESQPSLNNGASKMWYGLTLLHCSYMSSITHLKYILLYDMFIYVFQGETIKDKPAIGTTFKST